MPWSNQGGGWQGGGNRGPWSQGPSGGPQQPDLEELLKRGQDRFRKVMPGKLGGGGIGILILIALLGWLMSGFYQVGEGERGVEMRFGALSDLTTRGLNYHWPYPIETVQVVNVDQVQKIDVGFEEINDTGRSPIVRDEPAESLMLTGDENIVDVDFNVFWNIKNAPDYVFNVKGPDFAIKAVAESAMREVVGRNIAIENQADGTASASLIELLQTEKRKATQDEVQRLIQEALDNYGAGVNITQVQLQKVDPPAEVIEAFRDVQAARADKERMTNEARAYANKVVPEARGDAESIRKQADGYREQTIAQAQGEAQRFLSVYEQYKKAPDVTRRRMYLETMEKVLGGSNKVILDPKAGGSGVVPYLPLDQLKAREPKQ